MWRRTSALSRGSTYLSEGFELLDGTVEELIDEGVAHLLDGSGSPRARWPSP
jgi:hypothetical protein